MGIGAIITYKRKFLKTMGVGLVMIATYSHVQAQMLQAPSDCAGFGAIKQQDLWKYDPVGITNLIKRGCPPSKKWSSPVRLDLAAGGGGAPLASLGRVPAHMSSFGYKAKGVCSKLDGTKSGGKSDDGAIDPCKQGFGMPWFTVKPIKPRIPQFGSPNIDCVSNLYSMLTAFNPSNLTPQMKGGVSGSCASGTLTPAIVGECGLDSVSRNVCMGQQNSADTQDSGSVVLDVPYSRNNPPSYVIVDGVKEMIYHNDPLNYMTAIYLPNGGEVTHEGMEYSLDAGSFVTMNSAGEVFFGPNWTQGYGYYYGYENNYDDRIRLEPATGGSPPPIESYVKIIPNGQVVNVDSVIFEGNTLNQQVAYNSYDTTDTPNPNDGRAAPENGNPYDPRANVVNEVTQTGAGAQRCIEPLVADLADLPPAENYCIGAQRVGLSNQGVSGGQPTMQCPPELSLFCAEQPNQAVNEGIPSAAQYP